MTQAEDMAKNVLQAMTDEMDENNHWEGSLVNLLKELSIPNGYYSKVRTLLIRSGAAVQLRRGGGKAGSVWQIVLPDANFSGVPITAIDIEERRTLESRIRDLEGLVGGVNVNVALGDLAREIRDHDHA